VALYLCFLVTWMGAMYSVVAHNADPYLELDEPALFSSHRDAVKYAIETAIVFRAAKGGPTGFTISGPLGSVEWSIEALLSPINRYLVDEVRSA
jgi:hypothetical protein